MRFALIKLRKKIEVNRSSELCSQPGSFFSELFLCSLKHVRESMKQVWPSSLKFGFDESYGFLDRLFDLFGIFPACLSQIGLPAAVSTYDWGNLFDPIACLYTFVDKVPRQPSDH
jgi:hypothetical protein